MGVLWGKIGEGVVRYWPLTNSFFLLGALTSVPILVKIDQEMRPWECSQTDRLTHWHTDRLTDANRFYNLFHAICYSYGTDNNWYLKSGWYGFCATSEFFTAKMILITTWQCKAICLWVHCFKLCALMWWFLSESCNIVECTLVQIEYFSNLKRCRDQWMVCKIQLMNHSKMLKKLDTNPGKESW